MMQRMGELVLKVIGCGDAMGSGGRNNTCFLVDDIYGRFAIDFGATSLTALNAMAIAPDTIGAVYLTHLHGDHFGALPNLLLLREFESKSDATLSIIGPIGTKDRLVKLCEAMFPGMWKTQWRFPLEIIEAETGAAFDHMGRRILTQAVTHYAGPEASTAIRIETGTHKIAYSGDTGWNDNLIEISAGTDLFLCDCFDRFDAPFEGHMSYETLLGKSAQLGTKRLMMTHLGPHMIASAESFAIEQAQDGMVIRLP